jgi:alpha-L-fucosidase 2
MPSRHRIRLTTPAASFHDGFPLGNGALGAMVHGRPSVERIDLNIDTLWSGGPTPADQQSAPRILLPALRDAVRGGDFTTADSAARDMQGPGWTQSYQPLGWLEWGYAVDEEHGDYYRELDLARAVATTAGRSTGGNFQVDCFVSAPAGVLVASATGSALRIGSTRFVCPHPATEVIEFGDDEERWLVATGRAPCQVYPNYVQRDPAVFYADDRPDADGTVAAGMGFAVAIVMQRSGPEKTRLLASAATGFRGYDQRPSADLPAIAAAAKHRLSAAVARPTSALLAEHTEDHRRYYDRVDLDLSASGNDADEPGNTGPARAELHYHFGRYLLISSSRPGTQAANLQGIWNADVRPGWSSNYTTNINVEMNYWPAESTALPELHQPLFELIDGLAVTGAQTASRYYGAAGAAAHHNTDIWRLSTPVPGDPEYANWPSGLFWLAAHLWDHWSYGASDDFARDTVLPVLGNATRFALDMLVADEDGALEMCPSTSPEHYFLHGSSHAAISAGTAMDQELVHEVLARYIHLSDRLAGEGLDDDDLAHRAGAALARLRPVAISSDGTLLEWREEHPPGEPGHRHLSHLYGLYPGTRITESDTPVHFDAARRALRTRLENGSGHTGWSQAWVLCLAARLRDPELAEQSIEVLLEDLSSASMLDLHPLDGWPGGYIFQIDGNFGAVAGMTELIVQSHEGTIGLLKTLPPSWHSGSLRGIRCRGGHQVDVSWADGVLTGARISTGRGGVVVLDLPALTPELAVIDETAHAVPMTTVPSAVTGRQRLSFASAPHHTYRLEVHDAAPRKSSQEPGDASSTIDHGRLR